MNYKNIIKSQNMRLKILKLLDFVPDKLMIELQYKIATGMKLNLKKPKRFTEKIQWYKLYYRNPLMTKCADKYGVREYVASKGYGNNLIPLYGVYDGAEDINFDKLPNKFVLKTTNGSHTNIFCEDKSKLDVEEIKRILNNWLTERTVKAGREWAYYNIKPRIICEKYLDKDENNDLVDYKFFCFNGKPYCLYVIVERFFKDGTKLGIYDSNFNRMQYTRADMKSLISDVEKPKNFEAMLEMASVLSSDFPYVRVDLYNVGGEIIFGELTFYDGSGYIGFNLDEFDFILGDAFELPLKC